jgi:predicted peroxiredoxin
MKVLFLATAGTSDPTRASIPLHIAANGSIEVGQQCAVVLAGDATELVSGETAERVEGVGVPPVRELLRKLVDNEVPIYV